MPGGDRTGPMGMGPMTGRGAGYCAGYSMPGYMNPVSGRGAFGFGRGWGRGFGRGRGMGRGFGWRWAAYPYGYGYPYSPAPYAAEVTPQQEADMLKAQARVMQDEINVLNQRINELESGAASEGNA
ncbi:MAG: DUF5320 domain-containing protein [Candidatus Omnitrophica bacterium]|nr:DUF5320 domain-containing protein [Candidatus Omnitrophota bacterium]